MPLVNLLLFVIAFVLIWVGAGFIVSSTSRFSEKLRLSSFAVSFLLLGLLTSTPEFSVGLQAISDNNPDIFVGNLLGGIIVIFLLIIPLLAIFGNGINLKHEMDSRTLLSTMLVVIAPSALILDGKLTTFEGLVFIGLYGALIVIVERKHGLFDSDNSKLLEVKSYSYKDILKILLGLVLVFVSSTIIVDKTVYFADLFSINPFYIGLLAIAVGTDLPEISLVIRSVMSGKKDIAMGDYLGAAAASTLLFGVFTLLSGGDVSPEGNFFVTFIFIAGALSMFYFFSRSKKFISRRNGVVMIGIYLLFIVLEIAT